MPNDIRNIISAQFEDWVNGKDLQELNLGSAQYLLLRKMIMDFVLDLTETIIHQYQLQDESFLNLSQIQSMLNYKDQRSVIKWCEKHNVYILHQGNSQFVNRSEFFLAFHQPFIKHLQKSTKNWQDQFLKLIKGDLKGLLRVEKGETTMSQYKPQSKIEKSFLEKMKKL